MKRIGYFLIGTMLVIGACTTSFAQNHRHVQRNDSTEKVIMEENKDTTESAAYRAGFEDGEDLREFIDETVSDALEGAGIISGDREGKLVRKAVGGGLVVATIAVLGIFFGPAIILAIILFFIYKRKKQRDQVVIAAINKGVEVPAGYGSAPKVESANSANNYNSAKSLSKKQNPMMHDGILKIAIGIGLWVLAQYLHLGILAGIGIFVAIYGVGKVIIGYISGETKSNNEKSE